MDEEASISMSVIVINPFYSIFYQLNGIDSIKTF